MSYIGVRNSSFSKAAMAGTMVCEPYLHLHVDWLCLGEDCFLWALDQLTGVFETWTKKRRGVGGVKAGWGFGARRRFGSRWGGVVTHSRFVVGCKFSKWSCDNAIVSCVTSSSCNTGVVVGRLSVQHFPTRLWVSLLLAPCPVLIHFQLQEKTEWNWVKLKNYYLWKWMATCF